MNQKKGMLSVESENIFPIIKKWLYTEQDIFIREVLSNGSDAISKLKKLSAIHEKDYIDEGKLYIEVDNYNRTLKFIDNGIGMDAEEVDKYINQIAFSGATDFLNQYKDKVKQDSIIGHFGLGFYSTFMVANRVTIDSLSYKKNAEAIFWDCNSNMQYMLSKGNKKEVGTEITLYLEKNSKYLNPKEIEMIVKKYFEFYPIQITISSTNEPIENNQAYGQKIVNDNKPLWCRKPDNCEEMEYIDFYKKAFKKEKAPKFWVHLYDEKLGVKGIVYFRSKESMELSVDGSMRLYSNQVFISSEAKGLIPDFLFLQDGIIDCESIPLMVSRSALQEDENVGNITKYITEQIAFKIYGTFEYEREFYESIWEDLNPFIKFSCLKDKLFSSYVEKFILFKNISGKYVTLNEHLNQIKEKHENMVYYISDEIQQSLYIKMFQQAKIDALYMTHVVDQPYIKKQEMKNKELEFNRIDSDFYKALKEDNEEEEILKEEEEILNNVFEDILKGKSIKIQLGTLVTDSVSSVIILNEEDRRIRDLLELYETKGIDTSKLRTDFNKDSFDILFLNKKSNLVMYLIENNLEENKEIVGRQLYDLARLGQESLEAHEMTDFIERSNLVLNIMIKGGISDGK